jgi:hypothetical protein
LTTKRVPGEAYRPLPPDYDTLKSSASHRGPGADVVDKAGHLGRGAPDPGSPFQIRATWGRSRQSRQHRFCDVMGVDMAWTFARRHRSKLLRSGMVATGNVEVVSGWRRCTYLRTTL